MKTAPPALEVARTEGCRLHLADGRTLVDGIASWWTACHGYNHPHIRAAVVRQLERVPHVMFGGLTHRPAERLAAELAALLPGTLDHVFFTESGSVSVEVALKMSLQSWQNVGRPEKRRILAFDDAYHGDTFGTMPLCDPVEGMHRRFPGSHLAVERAPIPVGESARRTFATLVERSASELAAVVVEPLVQAAGGFRFHDAEALRFIREVCTMHDVHLIFDEIAVGFGRLGDALFACEIADVTPDVITLSKALTGGTLPLAATVASRPIFEAFWRDDAESALMHGPTYMANPLGCAAALASLELFAREDRLSQATRIGGRLRDRLAPLRTVPGVRDVRTCGALAVVELDRDPDLDWLRTRFVDHGVWVRPLERCVYLMPALVIDDVDLEVLCQAVERVVTEWSTRLEASD